MRSFFVRIAATLIASAFVTGAGAQVWQDISANVPGTVSLQNIRPMATDGARLYVLGDTGVFLSADGGASFTGINSVDGAPYSLDQDGHRFLRLLQGR